MKLRSYIFLLLGAGLLFFGARYNKAHYNPQKEGAIIKGVLAVLNAAHLEPKTINDDFSKLVYKNYLDNLDGGKRFLTQADVDKLKNYEIQLDDQILAGEVEFFNLSYDLMSAGVQKAKQYYGEWIKAPHDFTKEETIETDPDKKPFAQSDNQLKDYWRQYIKYELMTRIAAKLESQEKSKDEPTLSLDEIEKDARDNVQKMYDRIFNNWEKLTRMHRFDVYLNTVTGLYDPHTNYMTPKERQDFNLRMSGALEGIGARLMADGDYTKVSEIVLGGPAWKQGDLQVNDLIIKVTQDKEEPVNAVGMHIDDVVSMIRGKKGTKVMVTVRKADGTQKDISLIRDKVVTDQEDLTQSLIIQHENGDKVGYINLPSFYADLDDPERTCSRHVELELEKLKKEGVKGVVLDIRNNGGGYLHEVVNMTGLFIDKGPVVQVLGRRGGTRTHEDQREGAVYHGPLVVLVNEFSASASEILVGALQDYNRAIIVGSKATFGKGTVQNFYNLDQVINTEAANKPLGELKMTIQKYYRVNGESTQLRGVVPDINLPDRYQYFEVGEREYESAMAWNKIDALKYNQDIYKINNLPLLKNLSTDRVKINEKFRLIEENSKRLKVRSDKSLLTLNLKQFMSERDQEELANEKYKGLNDVLNDLKVDFLQADQLTFPADTVKMERYKGLSTNVKKDLYIDESIHIIYDMVAEQPKGKLGYKN